MLFTLCNNNKHSNLNLIDRHQFPWLTVSIRQKRYNTLGSNHVYNAVPPHSEVLLKLNLVL